MLIPFSWKPEMRPGFPCVAFRWTFQINSDFVGFVHQHYIGGVWRNSHSMINGLWYHGVSDWGVSHTWHDGPHCQLSIGPLRLQWWNDQCKKCGDF